ncbi:MAG: cobalamin biosynthesis protein [Magnetococcales bacterium]|nr:cobalamin biosynthesis protein [Magnetococcales bacterium]
MIQSKPALVAITKQGAKNAEKLAKHWPDSKLYILSPWGKEIEGDVQHLKPPLAQHIKKLLENHSPICFFCALGAVVRLAAPHLRSKREDPAVLAIDEMARFVIPVLSGHLGGANQYTREVAKVFSALPVITTASDSIGTIAVDLLGRDLGWIIEADHANLTRSAAMVVNDQPVAVVQECGSRRWLDAWPKLAENISLLNNIDQADPKLHKALLWITDSKNSRAIAEKWPETLVIYRPPPGQGMPLSIGIGCDRNTPLNSVKTALKQALADHYLDIEDIVSLATIDIKSDEAALLSLSKELKIQLTLYPAAKLAQVTTPNPSEVVRRYTGTPSVSEAAALLAADSNMDSLLVEKQRYKDKDGKNTTISIVWIASKGTNNGGK